MDHSPYQVYAALLDDQEYLSSVRTMYRILDSDKASKERRNQLRRPNYKKPELLATGPNQVWSRDITKLLGPGRVSLGDSRWPNAHDDPARRDWAGVEIARV